MLPIPDTSVWSSSARLRPVFLRRNARDELGTVHRRVEQVAGDVGDWFGDHGAVGAESAG